MRSVNAIRVLTLLAGLFWAGLVALAGWAFSPSGPLRDAPGGLVALCGLALWLLGFTIVLGWMDTRPSRNGGPQ